MDPKDGRHLGTQYLFYVAVDEPTDPASIADYTVVGMLTTWNRQETVEELIIRDKTGDDDLGADDAYSINAGTNAVAVGDDGQEILFAAIKSRAKLYWLKTDNVAGHIQEYGRAKVTQTTDTKDVGTAATAAFVLSGTDGITRAEVAA